MDAKSNIWKLQDAKARFSELVRRARAGEPQHVTLHGKEAVVVVDPARYDVNPKPPRDRTMAGFIEASKKYRLDVDIDFDQPHFMDFPEQQPFGKDEPDR
jgi:prevent-host-death family protein